MARGYDVLYEEHIVHRDIKPHNILVQYKHNDSIEIRTAKITDFGISRVLEPCSNDDDDCAYAFLSNVAGTLYYMAPEVGANLLKTCQYDFQVDMWSIGCVLYQCISGQVSYAYACRAVSPSALSRRGPVNLGRERWRKKERLEGGRTVWVLRIDRRTARPKS